MKFASSNQTPIQAYKYCPVCGGRFEHKGGNWLKCADCGYNFFVNSAPTVGAIIHNNKNEVLMVKRKIEPNKGSWDIPGGFMNLQETYEEALHREIEEELDVKIQLEEYVGSHTLDYLYSGVVLPILCMYSSVRITSGKIKVQDDVAEARFFGLNEITKLQLHAPQQVVLIKKLLGQLEKSKV